jgi:uncharacterized membrane protein YphA (DoxX/SURF4 family)
VGAAAVAEAAACLGTGERPSGTTLALSLVLAASGVSVLVGFLTPVAAVMAGSCAAGIGLTVFPAPTSNLFVDGFTVALVVIVSLAIALLGPGAFSLDSHLFGRREIVIPRPGTLNRDTQS